MSRDPKNTLLKRTTSLSINDRFTRLRGVAGQATVRQARENSTREANALLHQASIKNRRLAQQMERRPTVMAALKIKKKSIRQRLGPFDTRVSVQDRLLLPGPSGRASFRGRIRGRGLMRGRAGIRGHHVSVLASPRGIRRGSFVPRSRGRVLQRQSQSRLEISHQRGRLLTDLRDNRQQLGGRLRGNTLRPRRARGITTNLRTNQFRTNQLRENIPGGNPLRGRRLRGFGLRGTGLRRAGPRGGGFRGSVIRRGQGQQIQGQLQRNQFARGYVQRGRGMRGGRYRGNQQNAQRGSFRGLTRNHYNQPKPSKEELDNELDQYMSNSWR